MFGKFGDDPYLKSLDERPNIVEVKRSAKEKAPPFGGSFHSDWSFQKTPPSATLLHSKVIPPVGGDTLFANTQLAYEDLDDDMKDKIKDLQVIHSASLPYADDGFYATEKENRAMDILPSKKAKATQLHPLVKTHAETNKKCLFINPVYTLSIKDYSEEDSFLLLSFLYEHMSQDNYVYRCTPHLMMAMVGVIQVGNNKNLEDVKLKASQLKNSFVTNKERLDQYLSEL